MLGRLVGVMPPNPWVATVVGCLNLGERSVRRRHRDRTRPDGERQHNEHRYQEEALHIPFPR